MEIRTATPLCPPNAPLISYTLIRHIGLVLDELSSQGLELWQDERRRWRWRWCDAEMRPSGASGHLVRRSWTRW
jgi:hypothetical protein